MHKLICEKCGRGRMRTPSGAVCDAGHGGIVPASRSGFATAARHAWAATLPVAERHGRRWYVDADAGRPLQVWRHPEHGLRVPTGYRPGAGELIAASRDRRGVVVRWFVEAAK